MAGRWTGSLNHRQRLFVGYYLTDPEMNIAQAAMKAGYSPKYARQNGHKLIQIPAVKRAIETQIALRMERTKITQDDVLRELHTMMTSDVRNFNISENGDLVLRDGVPESAWRAVANIKYRMRTDREGNVTREIEYRLWDKPSVTKQVGEHLGMFVRKIEATVTPGPQRVIVVPQTLSPDEWEKAAIEQQAKLVEEKKRLAAEYGVE